jgi:hypothetical protein
LFCVWGDTTVPSQVCSGLLDEIACLVKTYEIAFCVPYCLTDGEVIILSGVRVFGRAFKAFYRFLLKVWHCYDVS